jgi:hypothetical protein
MLWFPTVTCAPGSGKIRSVDGWMRLALEIDLDADPLSGSLQDSRGVAHTFIGWTQLGAALDAAILSGREHLPPRDPRPEVPES